VHLYTGNVRKIETTAPEQGGSILPEYALPLDQQRLALNELIGAELRLSFDGTINCVACGRRTKKSFNQGYCFPCVRRLAECDICIVSPEKCHYEAGTCRDPEWADGHCNRPHIVYLANTSGVKVGITRQTQIPTRWIDQGATQALPIFAVRTRHQSGLLESVLKQHVADRTDWRRMLRGESEEVNLVERRDQLLQACGSEIEALREEAGPDAVEPLDSAVVHLSYPVEAYPEKIKSLNFDKTPEVGGRLQGIKGQYLIFDSGVLNIRKFGGYRLEVQVA